MNKKKEQRKENQSLEKSPAAPPSTACTYSVLFCLVLPSENSFIYGPHQSMCLKFDQFSIR